MSEGPRRAALGQAGLLGLVWLCASGAAAQTGALVTLDGFEPADEFGYALAVLGDVDLDGVPDYAIGAPNADAGGDRRGRVHVHSGATHALLHAFEGTLERQELGRAVAAAGDVDADGHADLVVGEGIGLQGEPRKVHVFSGATWATLHEFQGWVLGDDFGQAVAGAGDLDGDGHDDVAVGTPDDGCATGSCDGRVTVFSGADGSVLLDVANLGPKIGLGASVSGPGDLTGDGVPDLVVGAPDVKVTGAGMPGAVLVLSGADGSVALACVGPPVTGGDTGEGTGATSGLLGDVSGDGVPELWGGGIDRVVVWSSVDGAQVAEFDSFSLAAGSAVGDVTGDGVADLLLGEPDGELARLRSGASGSTVWYSKGPLGSYDAFGTAVAVLGDADADGHPEVLVGIPYHDASDPGRVLLLEAAPFTSPLVIPGDGLADTGFGDVLAAAGDVDNDGVVDLLSGEPFDGTSFGGAGRARVWSGRDGALLHDVYGDAAWVGLGWAVSPAGDVDRDGCADFAVGLPFRAPPLGGAVDVRSGRTGELLRRLEGPGPGDRFGLSLACVGDVDGDGVDELLVGAPYSDVPVIEAGAAYLISGASGLGLLELRGSAAFSALGNVVGGGGDVDGDDVPDLLVSVPGEPVGLPATYPGVLRVHSGASGSLLHALQGTTAEPLIVSATAIAGDLDLDGLDDVVVGVATGSGEAQAWSSGSWEMLWSAVGSSSSTFVRAVAGLADEDGDGRPEVLVGQPGGTTLVLQDGNARVVSGADGAALDVLAVEIKLLKAGVAVAALNDTDFDGRGDVAAGAEKFTGQPDGAIVRWARESATSPWLDLGAVLPGSHGAPRFVPQGSLQAGEPVSFALGSARAAAPAVLVAGLSEAGLALKGGTLVPAPDVLLLGLVTDGGGALLLATSWPTGVPAGIGLHAQFWVQDPAALQGWAASNGVRGLVP